jgi:hypothetical protein
MMHVSLITTQVKWKESELKFQIIAVNIVKKVFSL